jgi:hypothetical protein
MKTTLVAVLLLTATVCSAQPARTRENTNGSWLHPNLSIETWDERQWIIAGTTEPNTAGILAPTFKFTDQNLVPIAAAPLPTYRIQFNNLSKVLMDFTVDQNSGRIIMTGTDPINPNGLPMNMYVTVINAPNGAVLASVQLPTAGFSLIPHQVIYSQNSNQIVVVGTKIAGPLTSANFAVAPKTGFILILNAATLATINFIETNTPSIAGGNDSDMLESVTELPGVGNYFAGGSANGFNNPAEQNMLVVRVNGNFAGPNCIVDNTNNRSSVASVMYNTPTGIAPRVIALDNSSSFNTYELTPFDPNTCNPVFPAVRHVLGNCLPAGTVTNGFRLQQNPGGSQIIVAGYAWQPGAVGLRPFQTTTTPNLGAFVNAKAFQSNNASPLTGYFDESGAPVYINTPDIMVYHRASNRTFLVNPHTNLGFDMLRSSSTSTLACEQACGFQPVSAQWPFLLNSVQYTQSLPQLPALIPFLVNRQPQNVVLCSSTPLAPMDEEPEMERGEGVVTLFPNPAKDILEIEAEIGIVEAVIYDLNGGKVLEAVNTQNELGIRIIDISMLKAGVYVITLKNSEGTLERKKFVKE